MEGWSLTFEDEIPGLGANSDPREGRGLPVSGRRHGYGRCKGLWMAWPWGMPPAPWNPPLAPSHPEGITDTTILFILEPGAS